MRNVNPLVLVTAFFVSAMFLPGIIAFRYDLVDAGQAYFRSAIFILLVTAAIGVLTMNSERRSSNARQLLILIYVYLGLPFILAIPIVDALPYFFYTDAVFEMLSAITTTGATLVPTNPDPRYVPLLVYSATVSWMGAFTLILIAFSVLEPLNIGGFELISDLSASRRERDGGRVGGAERLQFYFKLLAPPYLLITAILACALLFSGERFLFAVIHAFSTIATSGITPYAHLGHTDATLWGELIMFIFLMFAFSYHFLANIGRGNIPRLDPNNPELRVVGFTLLVSLTLFAIFYLSEEFARTGGVGFGDFFRSFWGMLFTSLSFLATHGYVSEYWQFNVTNIEFHAASTYLIGLAMLGGGVATAAGGIKLLRIYAIYRLSLRELSRLLDPHSIAASGRAGRHLRQRGGINAFIFLMLFIAGVSASALMLSLTGLTPEQSLVAAISAATNCGPVLSLLPDHLISIADLSDVSRAVYGITMIFGRVEVFVIIALLNPEFWYNLRADSR